MLVSILFDVYNRCNDWQAITLLKDNVIVKRVYQFLLMLPTHASVLNICRAMTRPPRPSSTAECLCLIARLREEQASTASWEPRPPFEVAEMD